jgi:hypothetical protein
MKGIAWFPLVLAALVLGPAVTQAQRGRSIAAPSAGRYVRSTARSAPIRTTRRSSFLTNGLGVTNPYPGSGLGVNGINSIMTPGNLGVEAAIDPATQWNLALTERLLRGSGLLAGGGYYLLSGGGAYALPADSIDTDQTVQPQQQSGANQAPPQVIVLQQAPSQQALPQSREESAGVALPDVGQFTLILQNGKQIQAVAFTRMNDRIIYVTNDGSRRTIALNEIDTNATIRLNQERGTPLELPL